MKVYLNLLGNWQGQGYGKKILDTIEKEAYRDDTKIIVLLAHSKATWAIDFYEKNGFEVIETKENRIKKYANSQMCKCFCLQQY